MHLRIGTFGAGADVPSRAFVLRYRTRTRKYPTRTVQYRTSQDLSRPSTVGVVRNANNKPLT